MPRVRHTRLMLVTLIPNDHRECIGCHGACYGNIHIHRPVHHHRHFRHRLPGFPVIPQIHFQCRQVQGKVTSLLHIHRHRIPVSLPVQRHIHRHQRQPVIPNAVSRHNPGFPEIRLESRSLPQWHLDILLSPSPRINRINIVIRIVPPQRIRQAGRLHLFNIPLTCLLRQFLHPCIPRLRGHPLLPLDSSLKFPLLLPFPQIPGNDAQGIITIRLLEGFQVHRRPVKRTFPFRVKVSHTGIQTLHFFQGITSQKRLRPDFPDGNRQIHPLQ